MGLQKREGNGGGSALFLKINAKEGCVQTSTKKEGGGYDKIKEKPGDVTITGTVVGIEVTKDEYEGAVNYALRLKLADPQPGEPNMYVDLPFGSEANGASMFGLQVMGKLNAADLTKPVGLMPWCIPAGSIDKRTGQPNATNKTGCVVYQDGVKLVEDFGDGNSKLPELPVVKVGSKEVKDKSPWDALANEMLAALEAKLVPHEGESHAEEDVDVADVAAATQTQRGFAPRG